MHIYIYIYMQPSCGGSPGAAAGVLDRGHVVLVALRGVVWPISNKTWFISGPFEVTNINQFLEIFWPAPAQKWKALAEGNPL